MSLSQLVPTSSTCIETALLCKGSNSYVAHPAVELTIPKYLEVVVTALYEQSTFIPSYRVWFGNPWAKLLEKATAQVTEFLNTQLQLCVPPEVPSLLENFRVEARNDHGRSYYSNDQGEVLLKLYKQLAQRLEPTGYRYSRFCPSSCRINDIAERITSMEDAMPYFPQVPPSASLKHQVLASIIGEDNYTRWLKFAS